MTKAGQVFTPEQRERRRQSSRAYAKRHREAHREEYNQRQRNWALANAEARREIARRSYVKHADARRQYASNYSASHLEQRRQAYQRARQRIIEKRISTIAAKEAMGAALLRNALFAAAAAVVPRSYAACDRDDIIMSIVLAVLEGQLDEAQIAAEWRRFARAHFGSLSRRSIDGFIPGTRISWIETIPDGVSAFA